MFFLSTHRRAAEQKMSFNRNKGHDDQGRMVWQGELNPTWFDLRREVDVMGRVEREKKKEMGTTRKNLRWKQFFYVV